MSMVATATEAPTEDALRHFLRSDLELNGEDKWQLIMALRFKPEDNFSRS